MRSPKEPIRSFPYLQLGRLLGLLPCLLLGLLLGLLGACSGLDTNHDYDPEFDFDRLRTYSFRAPREAEGMDHFLVQRVEKAVHTELLTKGYRESRTPDFLVTMSSARETRVALHESGSWRYRHVDVHTYEEGSLYLNVVRAEDRVPVWTGVAKAVGTSGMTMQEKTDLVNEAVHELLLSFPPEQP